MSEKRATLEVIAPTVDEAIDKGLADLGLPKDAVEVEVLDPGSRGLFGLGSRHARVRLAVKSARQTSRPAVMPDAPQVQPKPEEKIQPAQVPGPQVSKPAQPEVAQAVEEVMESTDETHELRVARETVTELLEKMHVRAEVTSRFGERDDDRSRIPVLVDIHGDDLSILIGRRAETLNALQYISSLIVGKELGRGISLVVDVEGYRSRRESQLRQLAQRMADQAVKTGRRQVLEPMPANERRIVHMELRGNPTVSTESVGEEPRRKVTILPKE